MKPIANFLVPYPAIERHGVIGDRRTAALVAADGTLDWLCLPDYDGDVVFGALLDSGRGGFWRLGPIGRHLGTQEYRGDTATLVTAWDVGGSRLELVDVMSWPQRERPPGHDELRAVIRCLRCTKGQARCALAFSPHCNFSPGQSAGSSPSGTSFRAGSQHLTLWANRPLQAGPGDARAEFELQNGEEFWSVLTVGEQTADWSVARARTAREEAERYWEQWVGRLSWTGPRPRQVRRSALLVHLLSYAPAGSVVAAPTTSLPERVGGGWNADYRLTWVRDASLSLGILALVGNTEEGGQYLDWLAKLVSPTGAPLQVLYGVRGEKEPVQHERKDVYGYRGSLPIRFGNHAYQQHQHDTLGYLLDCLYLHLQQRGRWRHEFWELVRRAADFIASNWHKAGNSIWELSVEQHYLSGKVMSWVALDRALKIADQVAADAAVDRWRSVREEIHADVMRHGWSERLGAFRQRYEGDNLDAAALLIPVMGFLPADHPRVTATVARIAESLTIDGFVYRFVPAETPGMGDLPLGEYEGAFLPCTFWLATVHAKAGRVDEAEAILRRAESLAGPVGYFAEGVDARSGTFLGNSPLLFSQTEYVRAVIETARAQPGRVAL